MMDLPLEESSCWWSLAGRNTGFQPVTSRRLSYVKNLGAQMGIDLRMQGMINPNGEDFTRHAPLGGAVEQDGPPISPSTSTRFQEATQKATTAAGDAWRQTRAKAGTARERTEFYLRENPVPTVIGALAVGLAIGLAIRYATESSRREVETRTPFGNVNLGVLSLPFLWPFFKSVRRRYEDSAEVVKEGVDRLKDVDVDRYVKPLRKKWRAWTK